MNSTFIKTIWNKIQYIHQKIEKMAVETQQNNPLHGITLQKIVETLEQEYGWEELGERVPIRCFTFDPSVKSSLTFLRKTPWARQRVENLYIKWLKKNQKP